MSHQCSVCHGTGRLAGPAADPCDTCHGTGLVPDGRHGRQGCPTCGGTGEIATEGGGRMCCPDCDPIVGGG